MLRHRPAHLLVYGLSRGLERADLRTTLALAFARGTLLDNEGLGFETLEDLACSRVVDRCVQQGQNGESSCKRRGRHTEVFREILDAQHAIVPDSVDGW